MSSKLVGFRCPDDLVEQLNDRASEKGLTTSEFIRQIVDETLFPGKNDQKANLSQSKDELFESMKTLEGWLEELDQKVNKMQVCWNCGSTLHLHRFDDHWHLECLLCGFYTKDYLYPEWKGPPADYITFDEAQ
jgi:hypothetical protein